MLVLLVVTSKTSICRVLVLVYASFLGLCCFFQQGVHGPQKVNLALL